MMKKFLITVFLSTVCVVFTNGFSQRYWTLEECIQYALDHNLQVKRQALAVEVQQNNLLQSRMEMLPNLGAGANHHFSSGRALNQEDYKWENRDFQQGDLGLDARVTLFNGMQVRNTIKRNQFSLQSSLAKLEEVKYNITLNIVTAYLDILFSKELMEVARVQHELSLLQVERAKVLVEAGSVAMGSLLEIYAQAANEKVNLTSAENEMNLSYLALAQLLDLDSVGNFRVIIPDNLAIDSTAELADVETVYARALEEMPRIKGAELELSRAEKELAIAKGGRYPEVSLRGMMYTRYNELAVNPLNPAIDYPYFDQLKDNQYKQVTLGVYFPIFNKYRTATNIKNNRVMVQDQVLFLSQQKQGLYKDIRQAHTSALAAMENYISRQEAVRSNEEAFKYTQQRFEVGLVNSVDYNVAKNNLTKAQSDYIQAKYQYIFRSKILDFYRGMDIVL